MAQGYKNKAVLITGGGSGIGKAVATAFANGGANVVIAGRDIKKLKRASLEISKLGRCDYFTLHVENPRSAKVLAAKVANKFGRIDILVNCAGVYGPIGRFHTNDLPKWHKAVNINFLGTVNMIHAVLPFMLKAKKGKIINLAGGGAVQPFPNFSAYASGKAAVVRFTENLAKEYQDRNIQINAIAPGAVNTKFLQEVLKAGPGKAGKDFYQKSVLQKHTGGDDPAAAAELALFLCSSKLTGKLVSAKWDKWKGFSESAAAKLNKTSEYTLRRIDNKYFFEK